MTSAAESAQRATVEIRLATSPEDLTEIRTLLLEYRTHLATFIPAEHLCCDLPLSELDKLPGEHAPPSGAFALALAGTTPAGCLAMRAISLSSGERVAELRRLWVRPEFRNRSIARRLVVALIDHAKRIGHPALYLDTLPAHMPAAQTVYRGLGFVDVPRYGSHNREGLAYLRLHLTPDAS